MTGRRIDSLVSENYASLYRFAYRLSGSASDAEDLVQETFFSAQKKLDQLRQDDKPLPWLYAILRNHFLMKSRKDKRALELLDEDLAIVMAPAEEGLPDITTEQLQQALSRLPEAFRTPVILFYFQEMAYREIAEFLKLPIGTVMSRLARGKNFLKDYFHKELEESDPATGKHSHPAALRTLSRNTMAKREMIHAV